MNLNGGESAELRQFGVILRLSRKAAKMNTLTLASRSGLSEATIKRLEKGRQWPSPDTRERLGSVPELGLSAAAITAALSRPLAQRIQEMCAQERAAYAARHQEARRVIAEHAPDLLPWLDRLLELEAAAISQAVADLLPRRHGPAGGCHEASGTIHTDSPPEPPRGAGRRLPRSG